MRGIACDRVVTEGGVNRTRVYPSSNNNPSMSVRAFFSARSRIPASMAAFRKTFSATCRVSGKEAALLGSTLGGGWGGDDEGLGGGHMTEGALARGLYVEPTIVRAPLSSRVFAEEFFVPILAVGVIESLEQGIEEANRVEYGLTAGLFSSRDAEVEKFFDEIEAGVTYVNKRSGATTGAWPGAQPFCGWKGSGSSRASTWPGSTLSPRSTSTVSTVPPTSKAREVSSMAVTTPEITRCWPASDPVTRAQRIARGGSSGGGSSWRQPARAARSAPATRRSPPARNTRPRTAGYSSCATRRSSGPRSAKSWAGRNGARIHAFCASRTGWKTAR